MMPRVLSAAEFAGTESGIGWLENCFEWDEKHPQQSRHCLRQARPARANPSDSSAALPALALRAVAPVRLERFAWVKGSAVGEDGSYIVEQLMEMYNRPDGVRVWVGTFPPSDEQRKAVAWDG